jgi:hypothetical protein
MENISRGPTYGDSVTILSPMGRCRASRLQDYRVEYRLTSPPSIKCNVLLESLSEDSQNIPCATLKRKGSWVIFIPVHLWLCTWFKRLCFGKHALYVCDFTKHEVRKHVTFQEDAAPLAFGNARIFQI